MPRAAEKDDYDHIGGGSQKGGVAKTTTNLAIGAKLVEEARAFCTSILILR